MGRTQLMQGLKTGMLVFLTLLLLLTSQAEASCRGTCGACARRYGCMTPAWGRCCTQFFMHNGRKRSTSSMSSMSPDVPEDVRENFIEYVRLKSKRINTMRPEGDDLASTLDSTLSLMEEISPYWRPDISNSRDADTHYLPLAGSSEINQNGVIQDGGALTSGTVRGTMWDDDGDDNYDGMSV